MDPSTKTVVPGVLTLGWHVTTKLEPRYWLLPAARPGEQSDHDVFRVPAAALGCHTAIVAQSGSGKSFFLGRLVEELLLATKARCIIFDPNADFRRMGEVVSNDHWANAGYDTHLNRGFLPHEREASIFAAQWDAVTKRLQVGPGLQSGPGVQRMRLDWTSLSVEFLSGDVESLLRGELYHCHEFVKAVAGLLALKQASRRPSKEPRQGPSKLNFITEARRILRRARIVSGQDRRDIFELEFEMVRPSETGSTFRLLGLIFGGGKRSSIRDTIDRAMAAVDYISEQAERYYFAKAEEYAATGIIQTAIGVNAGSPNEEVRLSVVDLPSFGDPKTRLLPLNSVLSTVWERARFEWATAIEKPSNEDARVPTFIVLDEAHNLIPSERGNPAAEVLREQFRAIAAEGRKYGLFLIMCTQRPDKIDPMVLSECENIAIMRLGSKSVLDTATRLLGLEAIAPSDIGRCLQFSTGRALLVGRWTKGEPEFIYSAMRRTVEGGRNLRESHWALPATGTSSKVDEPRPEINVADASPQGSEPNGSGLEPPPEQTNDPAGGEARRPNKDA